MLFNSYPFIFIFLPVTFIGMFMIGRLSQRVAIWWMGLASLIFYAYWSAYFVLLLLSSVVFNYLTAHWIRRFNPIKQRVGINIPLILGLLANLGLLIYFKYSNFFLSNLYSLLGMHYAALDIILPLGISFFTFTQLAFLVDISLGETTEKSFGKYLLFVTFFPHLIAGPLMHHKQMMPQFANRENFRLNRINISLGLTIFTLGLAKKIFIADNFSHIADPLFTAAHSSNTFQFFEAWAGALAYTLQLYFDFSAYSEMAIGLSLLFNIRMPLNFNSPYKSQSMIDFWQRWHMSLTKYIGEYLYTPITVWFMRLSMNLSGTAEVTYTLVIPTLITFVIVGLWHGANWTFLAFGTLHGMYLVCNHIWRKFRRHRGWFKNSIAFPIFSCLLTYISAVFAFVIFRSEQMSDAWRIQEAMLGFNGISLPTTLRDLLPGLAAWESEGKLAFDGIFPNIAFSMPNFAILGLLVVGHVIIWCLPNIHQITYGYLIVSQDIALGRSLSKKISPSKFFATLRWKPNAIW